MRVLVAMDGSRAAHDALHAVRWLTLPEEIILLHAVEPPVPVILTGAESFVTYYADLELALREQGKRVLEETAALLPAGSSVRCRLEVGSAADAILSASEQELVDLVLVGARGLGRVRELFLGSVSHRVLYHASCPVMVVPGPAAEKPQRVLAPVHGEPDADRLVHFLKKQPFAERAEVRVLHVLPLADPLWPLDAVGGDRALMGAVTQAADLVGSAAEQLRAAGYDAVGATGLGAAATTILQEAESLSADLVMMGARSRPDVTRFLLGSVSHAVLHRAKCPVVILR